MLLQPLFILLLQLKRILSKLLLFVPSEQSLKMNCIATGLNEKFSRDVDRVVATNFAHANINHKASGMSVQLSLNNNGAYLTSKLICDYISIDQRVQPLSIFFRYWGKVTFMQSKT